MSKGIFPIGLVDTGAGSSAMEPFIVHDNFRRQTSGTAAGTTGIVIGTAGRAGRVYRVVAQNSSATKYYLQLFNKATAPVNTDVPVYSRILPASSELDFSLADINGLPCALGMGFAISSTAGVLTLAVATDLAFYSVTYTAKNA